MRTAADVLGEMFHPREHPGGRRHVELHPDEGVAYVDYDDPEALYEVRVRQVPKRLLAVRPGVIGEVAGIGVLLAGVTLAHDVSVTVEAAPGAAREQALEEFHAAYRRWEHSVADQGASEDRPPPAWPGERLFGHIRVSDDVDTEYRFNRGECGGHGTEWRCIHTFLPLPPPQATHLEVELTEHGDVVGRVTVPLGDAAG
ncbi:MAG: hypothetical protein ACXVYY_14750 [Oryzihumus sp.]